MEMNTIVFCMKFAKKLTDAFVGPNAHRNKKKMPSEKKDIISDVDVFINIEKSWLVSVLCSTANNIYLCQPYTADSLRMT